MTERKINDYVRMYYQALHIVKEEASFEKKPIVSYLTSIGIVEGELAELKKDDFSEKTNGITIREMAINLLEEHEEKQGYLENREYLIHLKNVTLYSFDGKEIYKFGELTLNVNQIIGVTTGTKK